MLVLQATRLLVDCPFSHSSSNAGGAGVSSGSLLSTGSFSSAGTSASTVDSRRGQAGGILRTRPVIDALGNIGLLTCNASLEVDDACVPLRLPNPCSLRRDVEGLGLAAPGRCRAPSSPQRKMFMTKPISGGCSTLDDHSQRGPDGCLPNGMPHAAS